MYQLNQIIKSREQNIKRVGQHRGCLWRRNFMQHNDVNLQQMVLCGVHLWHKLEEAFFLAGKSHLAYGPGLYLLGSWLRKKVLETQQTVLAATPASGCSQQMLVCKSLFELLSTHINKEGASPPLFLESIRKIEMAAIGNTKYENMSQANMPAGCKIYQIVQLVWKST